MRVEFYCGERKGQRIIGSRLLLGILGEHAGSSDQKGLNLVRVEFCCGERNEERTCQNKEGMVWRGKLMGRGTAEGFYAKGSMNVYRRSFLL